MFFNCYNQTENEELEECEEGEKGYEVRSNFLRQTLAIASIMILLLFFVSISYILVVIYMTSSFQSQFENDEHYKFPSITGRAELVDYQSIVTTSNHVELPFGEKTIEFIGDRGMIVVIVNNGILPFRGRLYPKPITCYDIATKEVIECKRPDELYNYLVKFHNPRYIYLTFYRSEKYDYIVGDKCFISEFFTTSDEVDYIVEDKKVLIQCNEFNPSGVEEYVNSVYNFVLIFIGIAGIISFILEMILLLIFHNIRRNGYGSI